MDEQKKKALEEVLTEMDQRINYGLRETAVQEREELKQEMITKLVEAAEKMAIIPLSEFEERQRENK